MNTREMVKNMMGLLALEDEWVEVIDAHTASLRERLRASELEAGELKSYIRMIYEYYESIPEDIDMQRAEQLLATPHSPYAEAVRAVVGAARGINRETTDCGRCMVIHDALAKLDEAGVGE